MLTRNPSDTVTMIHMQIDTLRYRLNGNARYMDQLDAAIEQGDKIDAVAAWQLSGDIADLRELADKLELSLSKLTEEGEAPCWVTSLVSSLAPSAEPVSGM